MANVIEETENLLILILIFGFIGLAIWAWIKYQQSGGVGGIWDALDGFFNGQVSEGPNPGGFSKQNVQGWLKDLFGGSDDSKEYTAQQQESMSELAQNYQLPTTSAIENALQSAPVQAQNLWNTLETDPGSLPMF